MRFISKFAMAVAAIFFAVSVSAGTYIDKSKQVCSKWVAAGWLPSAEKEHCVDVLNYYMVEMKSMGSEPRDAAKLDLGRYDN